MNKVAPFLFLLSAILISSCGKQVNAVTEENGVESLSFTISKFILDDGKSATKTTLGSDGQFYWAANDTVGIYPNTGAQVYFELTEGAGASSAEFDGGGWDFKASSTYYSYYPFVGSIYLDRNHIPVSYLGQKQSGISSPDSIGPFDFMYTPGSTAQSGNVNFSYKHLSCIIRLRCVLPAGTYSKLAIVAPTEVFPITGYYDLMAAAPAIVPEKYSKQLSIDLEGVTVTDRQEFYVYLMSAPVDLNGKQITVCVLNEQKTELQCKKDITKTYVAGTIYPIGCTSWTEVPQSITWSISGWDDGDTLSGEV